MPVKRELTCFYSDGVEYQTCQPVAEEAVKRGYEVVFTDKKKQKAEIGLYCQHKAYPENAKLSIVMLHDMAQGHGNWPNIWRREPWNVYDIGVLPGPAWEQRWNMSSNHPFARPRLGVIRGGWPKADYLHKNSQEEREKCKTRFGLKRKYTILYAPSWEFNNKQDEFIQSLIHLEDVDLILKQASWSSEYQSIIDNINLMNKKHENIASNVHVIDSKENIFNCILVADLIVSDESSVMFEGLLFDVPSIAVTNWMIPDQTPPRYPSIPYDFVIKSSKEKLENTVLSVLKALNEHKETLSNYRKSNFYDFTNAASQIMDAIDKVVDNDIVSCDFLESQKSDLIPPLRDVMRVIYWKYKSKLGDFLRKSNIIK